MSTAQALARELLDWDGRPESAEALRERVRAHPPVRGGAEPGMRGLAKAIEAYRTSNARSLGPWASKDRNAEEARALAPLIGDPTMGEWPFASPLTLPEADLVLWATVLRQLRPVVDSSIRRFLGVAFLVRRRQTWPAACRAWAALALRDVPLRDELGALWRRCYADPGPRWPKQGLGRDLGANGAHLLRHTLFLGCCWRAVGGDPEVAGLDPGKLAVMPLPADDADRSVVVAGLAELAGSPELEPGLVDRAKELGADELTEVAFRELLGRLAPGPARDAVREALIRARWKPARADALWEWLNTAAWFHERRDGEAVGRMLADAGEAEQALRWRIGDQRAPSPVDALVGRLGQLLDPDRFAVVPERRRAALLAETRLLMRSEDVAPLPWPALVRVALPGASAAMSGTVAEVGEPDLCVTLAERSLTSRTLMRDVVLDPGNVLRVGAIQDGFVAGQVAVQTERILRELPSTSDQVRFLWNLLQQDPPHRTFAELGLVLRAPLDGGGPPLRDMVRAVSTLDQRRDEGASVEGIAAAFAELVACARGLLGGDARVGPALDALGHAVEAAIAQDADPLDDPGWLDRLEQVVLGDGVGDGLVGWSGWLVGGERERTVAVRAMARLRAAAERVASARPAVTAEQHEELVAASRALRKAVGPLGWPETRLLDSLLQRLELRSADALAVGRRSLAAVEALHRLLERADEPALAALVRDPEQLRLLPVDELRRIHRDLLGQLRFADADVLRRSVAHRIGLPSGTTHRMPLFAAVAGGTFLVLDVADQWLALIGQDAGGRLGVTIGLALAASYGLLLADLGGRLQTPGASGSERLATLAVRALPTYLQAAAVSVGVSAIAMATLGELRWTTQGALELGLWSTLALFLGVFIGLVLQGQSATSGSSDRF